jgi:hypothetical protein
VPAEEVDEGWSGENRDEQGDERRDQDACHSGGEFRRHSFESHRPRALHEHDVSR